MLGINYASSDEEDETPASKPELTNKSTAAVSASISLPVPAHLEQLPEAPGPINGPSQGPSVTPPPADIDVPQSDAPGSPYTSNRAIIQNLTLPTVPNFNIPPSPPGSPPQRATKKFAQFLELKQKGQHFNKRLESSSVLRDPSHLKRLMDFARISEEDFYASSLPENIAVPTTFPHWAYVEELRATQKQLAKAKEQERLKKPRDAVDFVSVTQSGTLSGTGTPSGLASSKRKELEHRSRDISSSRSPKRRRSRSRDRM
ncbi:hypothetical protein ACN47E_001202 [Coniothyrium glycines]